MIIKNVEKWEAEVAQTVKDTFEFVDTQANKIVTSKGFSVHHPIQIKRSSKSASVIDIDSTEPWLTIEIDYDGGVILWNPTDWSVYSLLNPTNYRNKMSLIADMVRTIMAKDKYCTMY